MKLLPMFALLIAGFIPLTSAYVDELSNERVFFNKMLEVLPGNWQGKYADGTYENPTSDWQPIEVNYQITSGDTAIIENYVDGNESAIMTTVYHLDNNDIRATHFCGAQNHPRMAGRVFDRSSNTLSLNFVDVSNLQTPADYHSRGIDLKIIDHDNVHVTFSGLENGEDSTRVFALTRSQK